MNIQLPHAVAERSRPLEGKVSLITGSTSGIGLGIARALAAAGSSIVLNGFGKPEDIDRVKGQLASELDVNVTYSAADMANPASIADMIKTTIDELGRLDVLVNNAGIQHVAPLPEFAAEKWD